MLDQYNVFAKSFRMIRDVIRTNPQTNVHIQLIGKRDKYGRRYNLPSVDEVLVYAFSMVEVARLKYEYSKQRQFIAKLYKGRKDAILNGETEASSLSKRIILPTTFIGGPRYMIQNYQDAMAICSSIGYLDLFITVTCNPPWEELKRYCKKNNSKSEDRPDMVCRLFKAKLDVLIKDIQKNRIFGTSRTVIYTIEFQKRRLPLAHILLFLAQEHKFPSPESIDNIILAEISYQNLDPKYY
ncbi:uncharacterized protein [Arachis hypogaea]|uniref:uncharacterized protein n=1 Tax=Arachis hypogaea TaxID=3818 RepID=UPI003B2250A4